MAEEEQAPTKRLKGPNGIPVSPLGTSNELRSLNIVTPSSPPSSGIPGAADPPCAACKSLRRKCTRDCIFLPYFSREDPEKFARVHKVFGASNVAKMLQELPLHQREDAVASLEYEAQARVQDPVYGCVGILCVLQRQVAALKAQLAQAQSESQGNGAVPVVDSRSADVKPIDHSAVKQGSPPLVSQPPQSLSRTTSQPLAASRNGSQQPTLG